MFDFPSPILGLILTGGMSIRMGTDKSKLQYHDRPQKTFIYDLLSCYCSKTMISLKGPVSDLNYPRVTDRYDFGGPLNGILSAMTAFPSFAILSVPCDMPDIDHRVITTILKGRDTTSYATCFRCGDQIEPLLTIWEPAAFLPLTEQVDYENFSPSYFLKTRSRIKYIDLPIPFANINTPEEKDIYFEKSKH